MRNPERVLNSLSEHSKVSSYKFERLYRVLFNSEMFLLAYHNIQGRQGNMTEGSDGKTIDGMSLKRIENLIDALKDESYQPKPARRTYIPKKNGNMRPLGIPSIDDKLVQEVLRMLLEAIYEGSFENTSHGFRPKRSCHTALIQVQKNFTAAKWFIEGDIEGFLSIITVCQGFFCSFFHSSIFVWKYALSFTFCVSRHCVRAIIRYGYESVFIFCRFCYPCLS